MPIQPVPRVKGLPRGGPVGGLMGGAVATPGGINDVPYIGEIRLFASVTAIPAQGWVYCDGTSYPRASDAGRNNPLFTAIGTSFGAVDGTHFNVPDFRSRSPIGSAIAGAGAPALGAGLTVRITGDSGGSEIHTLITNELPAHTHSITDVTHNHAHNYNDSLVGASGSDNLYSTVAANAGKAEPALTNTAALTGITGTNSTGAGAFHNNMHPYLCASFAIYYGG